MKGSANNSTIMYKSFFYNFNNLYWSHTSSVLLFCSSQVNIQPSEWHRSLLLPQAWRGFMSRAFHAALQVTLCVCITITSDIGG